MSMVTMDMGTDELEIKEVTSGHYETRLNVSMAGSWRVHLKFQDGHESQIDFFVGKAPPAAN